MTRILYIEMRKTLGLPDFLSEKIANFKAKQGKSLVKLRPILWFG